jgi:nitroreductase
MSLIGDLKWRYATKKYDASKIVSVENIAYIKEAIQLSASSYGLQAYKVLIIEDKTIREKLKPVSWGQTAITDASHLLVFCNYTEIKDETIENFIQLKAEITEKNCADFKGYGDFMKAKLNEKSSDEINNWTSKQTYIALSNALNACAELKIDSTPIEGFEPEAYNEILGLAEKGLNASVVLAIGYRSEEDVNQLAKKVRKPLDELFEVIPNTFIL